MVSFVSGERGPKKLTEQAETERKFGEKVTQDPFV